MTEMQNIASFIIYIYLLDNYETHISKDTLNKNQKSVFHLYSQMHKIELLF